MKIMSGKMFMTIEKSNIGHLWILYALISNSGVMTGNEEERRGGMRYS